MTKNEFETRLSTLEAEKQALENYLSDLKTELDNFDQSDYLSNSDYDNFLDEVFGDVEICGYTYSSSKALEDVDSIAYRCGFTDYCDSVEKDSIPEYQILENRISVTESDIEDLESEISDLTEQYEEFEASQEGNN
jgi:predicted  nucleic acid-binding Zn-ribbon protein